jgi:hypothetical protein
MPTVSQHLKWERPASLLERDAKLDRYSLPVSENTIELQIGCAWEDSGGWGPNYATVKYLDHLASIIHAAA